MATRSRIVHGDCISTMQGLPEEYADLAFAELAQLQWSDVHLDDDTPYIALRAATTKSKRADSLPLPEELSDALKAHRPQPCHPESRVFKSIPKSSTVKDDLVAAGIDPEEGGKLDFHALRSTFNMLLQGTGASVTEARELMRHTDVRLTMQNYFDPRLLNTRGAVDRIPKLAGNTEREAMKATGTYSGVSAVVSTRRSGRGRNSPERSESAKDVAQSGTEENTTNQGVCAKKRVTIVCHSIGGGGNRLNGQPFLNGQNTTFRMRLRSTHDIE